MRTTVTGIHPLPATATFLSWECSWVVPLQYIYNNYLALIFHWGLFVCVCICMYSTVYIFVFMYGIMYACVCVCVYRDAAAKTCTVRDQKLYFHMSL